MVVRRWPALKAGGSESLNWPTTNGQRLMANDRFKHNSAIPAPSSSIQTQCNCTPRARLLSSARYPAHSRDRIPGRRFSRFRVGGICPFCMATIVAATPAAPHAPCGCPICDFKADIGTCGALFAQHQFQRPRLDAIVQLRRGSMQVHVVHVRSARSLHLSSPAQWPSPVPRRIPATAPDERPRRSNHTRKSPPESSRSRARACSYSSSTNIHAPSPSTNPSRSTENGREPFLRRVVP